MHRMIPCRLLQPRAKQFRQVMLERLLEALLEVLSWDHRLDRVLR